MVWVWWRRAAWPQQSPDGGRRPDAGIAFKFPGSWHRGGSTQPGCRTPEVSGDPCWVGCSDFSLRKSCCMTLSWLIAGTHVLQKGCGTRLQSGKCLWHSCCGCTVLWGDPRRLLQPSSAGCVLLWGHGEGGSRQGRHEELRRWVCTVFGGSTTVQ